MFSLLRLGPKWELSWNPSAKKACFGCSLKTCESVFGAMKLKFCGLLLACMHEKYCHSICGFKRTAFPHNSGPGGVTLQIKAIGSDGTDPLQHQFFFLKLDAPPEPSRKPSMQWNGALVKGLRMVLESRYQSELEDE